VEKLVISVGKRIYRNVDAFVDSMTAGVYIDDEDVQERT
jgi:hypothetical protein